MKGSTFVTLELTDGIHDLHFKKGGDEYVASIRADGGGESYVDLSQDGLAKVQVAREGH